MTVALIATFLNEADSMEEFLASVETQTRAPDEIILVDGGSRDGSDRIAEHHPNVTLLRAAGNRSVGRNVALRAASADVIAATDLGCRLDPGWLEAIVRPLEQDDEIDVVMGWTVPPDGEERRRAAATVLTVPVAEVDPDATRPSTRSVAFRRTSVVDFPEQFAHNEDAVWFIDLRQRGLRFAFAPDARVVWRAPDGPRELFRVVQRYGFGDGEAGLDPKSYTKVAAELGALAILAISSSKMLIPRVLLAGALAAYVSRMGMRAESSLGEASFLQRWLRVPAYGLVVKAAQVSGYARGAIAHDRRST